MEQSVREKTELQKELDLIKEECSTLKLGLQRQQQDLVCVKVCSSRRGQQNGSIGIELCYVVLCCRFAQVQNEQQKKENAELVGELEQAKAQNGALKSTLQRKEQEIEKLKVRLQSTVEIQRLHYYSFITRLLPGGALGPEDGADGDRATENR